jgi:hypothetical protein
LFASLYNYLLFLAKTNKDSGNNIDFLLSKGQNLMKYSSIFDKSETKQRRVVKLCKQSYNSQVLSRKRPKWSKLIICFRGNDKRYELATERSGMV